MLDLENPELVSKLGQDIVVIDISGIKVADRVDETEMAKEKRFLENSCKIEQCKQIYMEIYHLNYFQTCTFV